MEILHEAGDGTPAARWRLALGLSIVPIAAQVLAVLACVAWPSSASRDWLILVVVVTPIGAAVAIVLGLLELRARLGRAQAFWGISIGAVVLAGPWILAIADLTIGLGESPAWLDRAVLLAPSGGAIAIALGLLELRTLRRGMEALLPITLGVTALAAPWILWSFVVFYTTFIDD